MLARLIAAAIAGLAGGLWLWRRAARQPADDRAGRLTPALRTAALGLCGVWAVAWVCVAAARVRYPFELEWCGGTMLETVRRVLAGLPIYVPPGAGWFPYIYPPLYFWLSAGATRALGAPAFEGMRLISICSTLACAWIIVLWLRRIAEPRAAPADTRSRGAASPDIVRAANHAHVSAQRSPDSVRGPGGLLGSPWPWIAAGLFLAAYRTTGAWYDIERVDMLFLALSLLGGYLLEVASDAEPPRRMRFAAGAGLALSLAFLTKQQASLFIVAGAVALMWQNLRREAALFAAVCGAGCLSPALLLGRATHGWYGYYILRIPLASGVQKGLALLFVYGDAPLYAPLLVVLVLAALLRRRERRAGDAAPLNQDALQAGSVVRSGRLVAPGNSSRHAAPLRWTSPTLACMAVAALIGSLVSRAHSGGFDNVLIPFACFTAIAACTAAAAWCKASQAVRAPLYALALAQLLVMGYRPSAQVPTAANLAAGYRYARLIRSLEADGEVYCQDHGAFTRVPHCQFVALADVTRADHGVPAALVRAWQRHRFAAIVMDAPPGGASLTPQMVAAYPEHREVGITTSWCMTGTITPGPDRRVYVLRPQRETDPAARRLAWQRAGCSGPQSTQYISLETTPGRPSTPCAGAGGGVCATGAEVYLRGHRRSSGSRRSSRNQSANGRPEPQRLRHCLPTLSRSIRRETYVSTVTPRESAACVR